MSINDLIRGLAELDEACDDYDEAQDFYEGEVHEVFASPRIRRLIASTGQDYKFNLAKKAVDAVVNRIKLAGVSVPGNDAATSEIALISEANDMRNQVPNVHLRTSEYGDGYLQVWLVDGEEDSRSPSGVEAPDAELTAAGIEITYCSPKSARILYDEKTGRQKICAIFRWVIGSGPDTQTRVDVYYSDVIEEWVTKRGTNGSRAEDWVPHISTYDEVLAEGDLVESSEPVWPLPNPLGEIPFFHFRNATPYGRPEHKDAYGPQNAVNKLLITQMTTTDDQGWPQRYGLLAKDAALDRNGDSPDLDDDLDFDSSTTTATGAQSSTIRNAPGSMQLLEGLESIGEFNAADPKVFTDPAELYINLMAVTTDTPMHEMRPSADQPSGESRRMAEGPLVMKVRNRIDMYTATWQELWKFVLKLRGFNVDTIDVQFAPVFIAMDATWWEIAEKKAALGVPQRQLLLESGYTPAQLDAWGITETENTPAPAPAPAGDE